MFDFNTYSQKAEERKNFEKKVKYLELEDGDEALVRINYTNTSEFIMTDYHTMGPAMKNMKVECLKATDRTAKCPLCELAKQSQGKGNISYAKTRIFVPMLVSYLDNATQEYKPPVAVMWDAPAVPRNDFAQELAMNLKDYGSLRDHVGILRRIGKGFETKYSLKYVPMFDNDKVIKNEEHSFDDFNNYDVSKNLFYVKTPEEIDTFVRTGAFPERVKAPKTNTSEADAIPFESSEPSVTPPPVQTAPTPTATVSPTPTVSDVTSAEVPKQADSTTGFKPNFGGKYTF